MRAAFAYLRSLRWIWLAALVLLGLGTLLSTQPHWQTAIWQILTADSLNTAIAMLRRLGVWAPVASLALMIIQAVITPLPSSLIAAANGVLFGLWWGSLISWIGGMLGAIITYALGRWLGSHAEARWGATPIWRRFDDVGDTHGFWIVLMARLTPIISLDFIGYIAGAWRLPFDRYLLANAIGLAPGMLIYTIVGHDLAYARDSLWRIVAALVVLVVLFLIGRHYHLRDRGIGRRGDRETR